MQKEYTNTQKTEIENIKHEEGGLNSGNLWKLKKKHLKQETRPRQSVPSSWS